MYQYSILRKQQAKKECWYLYTKYNVIMCPTYPAYLKGSDFFIPMHDKIHPITIIVAIIVLANDLL